MYLSVRVFVCIFNIYINIYINFLKNMAYIYDIHIKVWLKPLVSNNPVRNANDTSIAIVC